jgi:hypothetical protein
VLNKQKDPATEVHRQESKISSMTVKQAQGKSISLAPFFSGHKQYKLWYAGIILLL